MRMKPILMLVLVGVVGSVGCGGGADPLPLVSGNVTGTYDGDPFTATSGFATIYQGTNIIGLGDGDLHCGSPEMNDPPPGYNAIITVPMLEVGTYSNVFVQLFRNVSEFEGHGSNNGTLTLTSVTSESVAGSIGFTLTDTDGKVYSISGDFEVSRCP